MPKIRYDLDGHIDILSIRKFDGIYIWVKPFYDKSLCFLLRNSFIWTLFEIFTKQSNEDQKNHARYLDTLRLWVIYLIRDNLLVLYV